MNKEKLIKVLTEIVKRNLSEGKNIENHLCSIAIKALDKCFDDIRFLKRIINNTAHKKI